MKQNLSVFPTTSFIRVFCLLAFVFATTSGFTESQKNLTVGKVPDNIKVLLADYSQHINSGKTSYPSFYTNSLKVLIKDRRDYYNELYKTGLHTNLTSIQSGFHFETASVSLSMNQLHIELLETVTMFGYPILDQAENYPMISAARWAITNTNNDNVKQALEKYVASTADAVNYSIFNGAETVFRVQHSIDISIKGGQLQFVKDEFTDKEIDNGDGFDNVAWVNNVPIRSKPDLTSMPDYIIYNTPVEVLGQQLLDDYTRAYGESVPLAITASFTYARTSAANYRVYSSNTTKKCPGNSSIFQDTAYYNQLAAYKAVWMTTGCDDCTDYVSQALRQGGFPTDTIWKFSPAPGTYTWRVADYSSNPQGLFYWLDNTWAATTQYTSSTSLQLGDLMTDSYYWDGVRYHGAGHVVIVTRISPVKYSGHTNDRKDYLLSSSPSLSWFWHIKDNLFH
jgi:hypothetical protein